MTFADIVKLSDEEREEVINSGLFNSIIQGYCIMGMKRAGFTDKDIAKIDFPYLFDSVSAWEARQASNDE